MTGYDYVYKVTGTQIVYPTDLYVIDPTPTATVTLDRVPPEAQRRAAHRRKGEARGINQAMSSTKPVALVTGASAGIGEQLARQLAERGHDLVLVARDRGRSKRLAKDIEAECGAHCEVLSADLTVPTELAEVEARARDVDVLVNNAGFGSFGRFDELDIDVESREVNLNVLALVRLTHAAAGGDDATRARRNPECLVVGRPPTRSDERHLQRDEGLRHVVHAGRARGVEGNRRCGHRAVPRLHAHRVPGARRTCPRTKCPASCGRRRRKSPAPDSTAWRGTGRSRFPARSTRRSARFPTSRRPRSTRRISALILKRASV